MYSETCSRTYTRRCSVPFAHDLITNSHALPALSLTGRLYDLHTISACELHVLTCLILIEMKYTLHNILGNEQH